MEIREEYKTLNAVRPVIPISLYRMLPEELRNYVVYIATLDVTGYKEATLSPEDLLHEKKTAVTNKLTDRLAANHAPGFFSFLTKTSNNQKTTDGEREAYEKGAAVEQLLWKTIWEREDAGLYKP